MKIQAIHSVRRGIVVALTAAALSPLAAMAAEDYTRYSNEELVQLRSQAQNMGEADRLRYREEMQTRTQNMSAEERNRLGVGQDDAQKTQTRERTRTGEDNTNGQGTQTRERTRTEQRDADGYGRGYESRQSGSGSGMSGGMGGSRGGMGSGGGRGR